MTANREPMSPADAAWLQMDAPANRMIITSVMEFDGPIEEAALARTLRGLAQNPRFHQRVVAPLTPWSLPRWEDDPAFDLRAHLHNVALPPPAGDAELQRFVSERMSTGLPADKPLWEMDHVRRPGAGSVLVLRVHHCLGDGITLVRILLGLAESEGIAPPAVGQPPAPPMGSLTDFAAQQVARARMALELLVMSRDRPTPFRGKLGLVKRAAWSAPIPLAPLKAAAREQGATVNDMLMAALSGALRSWLLRRRAVPDRAIRAIVPVFMTGAGRMNNRFSLVFVDLPVGEEDADARLRALKRCMDGIKESEMATVAFAILRLLGAAGRRVEHLGVSLFTSKATVMVTNVPGPPKRVRLCGREMTHMMTWAPASGSLPMSASLLSYGGEVRLGIAGDATLLDPDEVVRAFEAEIDRGLARPPAPAPVPPVNAREQQPSNAA